MSSVDPKRATVKVSFPDLDAVSNDLPVLQRRTLGNRDYSLPKREEQVLCAFLGSGIECGFVLGSIYSLVDVPPVEDAEKRHYVAEDGSWWEYDHITHKLTACINGEIDVRAAGSVTIAAEGDLHLQAGGDVIVNGTVIRLN
ncbi:MAG: phage baseplate assembly protein V [Planctomycetaceae bacterium]|nr:phage baseplate assembly protein V [Planctomycetaceae bacterium]